MRNIKFRAWLKNEKVMGEVTRFTFSKSQYPFVNVRFKRNGKTIDDGFYFEQEDGYDNVILMQFTGYHDKNGEEIYEGDIIRDNNSNNVYYLGFVRGCMTLFIYNNTEWREWVPVCKIEEQVYRENFEVVGNIYE